MAEIPYLPIELVDLILDNFDTEFLKSCREVSRQWNRIIISKKNFHENLCFCHTEADQCLPASKEQTQYVENHGPPIDLTSLRLRNLYSFWNSLPLQFFKWMNAATMKTVTWLEIQKSQLKISQLFDILGELVNIKTLRVTGETIIHMDSNTMSHQNVDLYGRQHFKQLQNLTLHFEDLHNFLQSLKKLRLLDFTNLKVLDLKGSAGNATDVFRIGPIIQQILAKNAQTLTRFSFDNFHGNVRGALDTKLTSSKHQLRSSLYAEFPRFLTDVNWKELNLNHLREVSFQRFPIANMNESLVQESLIKFFRNAQNLEKLSISQLYFGEDLQVEQFLNSVPRQVSIRLTSVHLYAPNPNLNNILEVMHSEQNILKYQEVSVQMGFLNLDWVIHYLTWTSLKGAPVLEKYSGLLQKLILRNILFPIKDEDFSFIINEAKSLKILSFEGCDLSKLTDSGITGLSSEAVSKCLINGNYKSNSQDFIHAPIQNIKGLHTLKLSNVGGDITHVSIQKSFLVMPQLRSLTIHQDPMVIRTEFIDTFCKMSNISLHYQKPTVA